MGGVEIKKKIEIFLRKKYQLPCFKSINLAYKKTNPKLIVISVSIDKFDTIYNSIYQNKIKPKAFIIEKPGAFDYLVLKKFYIYCKKRTRLIFL